MKTIINFITIVIMISIFSACSKQESKPSSFNQDNKEYKDIFPIFKLWWKIARPSTNCTERWGLCEGHFILLGWQIFKSTSGEDFGVNGSGTIISILNGSYLKATFKNLEPYTQDTYFEVWKP